ncbi:MAG: hypothetical protein Q4C59_00805 [Lachnospiraceae bacterium]|nr:hypothetical protein [Lachnospiraceae bacterium]
MENFVACIDEMVKALMAREQALVQSDRKDEANMIKIQINICGVCKTIYEVVCRTCAAEDVKETYLQKLDSLSDTWTASLEKARAHDDIEKIVAEELKLEALSNARNKFLELSNSVVNAEGR